MVIHKISKIIQKNLVFQYFTQFKQIFFSIHHRERTVVDQVVGSSKPNNDSRVVYESCSLLNIFCSCYQEHVALKILWVSDFTTMGTIFSYFLCLLFAVVHLFIFKSDNQHLLVMLLSSVVLQKAGRVRPICQPSLQNPQDSYFPMFSSNHKDCS